MFKYNFRSKNVTQKLILDRTGLIHGHSFLQYSTLKETNGHGANNKNNIETFQQMMFNRYLEARRSLLINATSMSFPPVKEYCAQFGSIRKCYFHPNESKNPSFFLFEYNTIESAKRALCALSHTQNSLQSNIAVGSRFLAFTSTGNKRPKTGSNAPKLTYQKETNRKDRGTIIDLLRRKPDINEQIMTLYEKTSISDLSCRLRFLAALQIEQSISGFFPQVSVKPFGSSVNGFGRMQSDLDLIVSLRAETSNDASEVKFKCIEKTFPKNLRGQVQQNLYLLANIMKSWLPGISNVIPILNARVPIVKYNHEYFGLEVDLSMGSMSGYYMSEMFYTFGQIDSRVRPFTFFIRRWAEECELTNSSPGDWITNFSLSCLVIFFFQQLKNPILPSLNHLVLLARRNDYRMTDDNVNCSFLTDIRHLDFKTQNHRTLEELLLEFFEFYSTFNFSTKAISICTGSTEPNLQNSPINIINPLEISLNVSRNISEYERSMFVLHAQSAIKLLTSDAKNGSESKQGILSLFSNKPKRLNEKNVSGFLSKKKYNRKQPKNDNEVPTLPSDDTNGGEEQKAKKRFNVKLMDHK